MFGRVFERVRRQLRLRYLKFAPRASEVCSRIHLKCAGILYWVLGLHMIALGEKKGHISLFPPRVLHGCVQFCAGAVFLHI